MSAAYLILQLVLIVLLAPLINGIIKKVKAFTQKRKGAPLFQMYLDLFKLMKKEAVVSDTASWIFRATPYIVLSTSIAAAALVPATTVIVPGLFAGDAILLVYLLAMGRFFMTLSGLDTGSTFGGMGSSREALISSLMEPALIVVIFSTGLVSGSTSLWSIVSETANSGGVFTHPVYIFLFLSVFIIILAETSRIPVDDPATHLELTMVHEAMILEYSGRHLAFMELGASVKQLVFITLLVNLFIPSLPVAFAGGTVVALLISLAIYILKIVITAVLIAIAEASTVKFRLFSVPNLAALSFILAVIGFAQNFVTGR